MHLMIHSTQISPKVSTKAYLPRRWDTTHVVVNSGQDWNWLFGDINTSKNCSCLLEAFLSELLVEDDSNGDRYEGDFHNDHR